MIKSDLLNLYDAVLEDDGDEITRILSENIHAKIPVRTLTGLLVIAVDNKLVNASRALLEYNNYSQEKISDIHFNAIICLAAKANLLGKLQITHH